MSTPQAIPKTKLITIPGGRAGTRATLRIMSRLISAAKKDPFIRQKAEQIIEHIAGKDFKGEARAIHSYVRDEIRYLKDIDGVERVAEPRETMRTRRGDCDDKVVVAGSLLQSIGHPVRLIAAGYNYQPYSHVYLETLIGPTWYPMELTECLPFGTPPGNPTSIMVEHIINWR
jgi:transglutaminase-like putative cysteine protease